jgi:hypothetical protein
MNNILRNTVLALVALAAISVLAGNFSGSATTTSTAPARHYYLTKGNFKGNQALTACTTGYHFASFAEISDPGVLTYNKTLGRSAADDGAGPPAEVVGWIRTGFISYSAATSPQTPTNCNVWTSGAATDQGEAMSLNPSYDQGTGPPGFPTPVVFFGNGLDCDNGQGDNIGVWCVQN